MLTVTDLPPGTHVEACIGEEWHKGIITDAPPNDSAVLKDLDAGKVCVMFDKPVEFPPGSGGCITHCTYEPSQSWRLRLDRSPII